MNNWTISDSKFVSWIEENEDKIIQFMKAGLNDANPDARNQAQANFHSIQDFNPMLCKRVWNECGESVHKHLNKTFSSLDSHNVAIKKNNGHNNMNSNNLMDDLDDDSNKNSPHKHKLMKSRTKQPEVIDKNDKHEIKKDNDKPKSNINYQNTTLDELN